MPVFTSSIEVTADYPTIKPSFNLNFARSRALDPRITFTRASTATYIGRDGLVKYAGEDEPRFDHDPDTLESLGLLIEESRTNLITNSALPLSAAGGNLTSSNLTVSVAVSTVSPDGTTDGVFRYTSGPGAAAYRFGAAGGGVAQATYTGSIWARAVSGTATFNIDINDVQAVAFTVDETWRRVAVSGARSDANAYRFMDVNASPNNDLYFWGPQLEQATFETSYIKTTGSAVTRAVDFGVINGTSFTNIFNYNEGTFSAKVRINGYNPTGYPRPFMFALQSNPGAEFWQLVFNNSGQNFFTETRENTGTPRSNSAVFRAAGEDVIVASAVKNGEGLNSYYGGSIRTNSGGSISPSIDSLIFNQNNYNGTISNLSYYPQRLTDAQLQLLTA